MAYFAELNEENCVLRVLRVPDSEEHRGAEFLAGDLKLGGTWIQTSFNATIRGKFAGIGDIYNADLDRFIAPQPFASWALDTDGKWQPPVAYPDDGAEYNWNEAAGEWVLA